MATRTVIGSDGQQIVIEFTPEQEAQRQADQAEREAYLADRLAELLRIAAFHGDAARQEYIHRFLTATPDQVETFVRARLNADAVTDLATAKAYCKRVETAFAVLMKVIALLVPQPPVGTVLRTARHIDPDDLYPPTVG